MAIGNIDIADIITLATFDNDEGKKCFGFIKMDAGEIAYIKESVFGVVK